MSSTKIATTQCLGMTDTGNRCQTQTLKQSFCWRHYNQQPSRTSAVQQQQQQQQQQQEEPQTDLSHTNIDSFTGAPIIHTITIPVLSRPHIIQISYHIQSNRESY